MIARSVIFLRAELLLIDLTAVNEISEDDQLWTASFLLDALSRSTIRRSARVVSADVQKGAVAQQVLHRLKALPYETGLFHDVEQAKAWLLQGADQQITEEGRIRIPLNFNMKLLRNQLLRNGRTSHIHLTEAKTSTLDKTDIPAPLPAVLSISTEFVTITINQHHRMMSINWKRPPVSRQYRFGMLKAVRALKQHKLERILLNNQRLGVLTLEDQGWLISSAIELLPDTSLLKLAVVNSADALQQMSSEIIGCKLKEANLSHNTRYFLSEEDALDWLQETE